jgi:rod shape-determining protein MreC
VTLPGEAVEIKGGDYFGSVYWDGTSYRHLTLSEIPKYAQIHAGDTIVTTAHSSIFPPDLTIGTVESFELNNATYYDVKVRLHTDIAALNNVLAVRYIDADERGALEQSVVAPKAE